MRVGVVGVGTMGRVHAAAWSQTEAELVGFTALDAAAAAALAARYRARAFASFEALLREVDVVDLCVPTDLHCAMTVRAAEAGKHVVCEKPLALSVSDGERMIRACEAAGVRLFVAMVVRFFPQYALAARAVQASELGSLGVLRLQRVSYPPQVLDNWFADPERSGGMLVDLMIHDFDYARWLAGPVTRVFAKSVRTQRRFCSALPGDGAEGVPADYALVTLRHEGGTMSLIEGGWAHPPGVFRTSFDLAGSSGVLEWRSEDTETIHPYLRPTADGRGVPEVGIPSSALLEDPYTAEIRHVCDALLNDKPFLVTASEALEALRLALAARRSLETGRPVHPEEVA
jgi:myo-inositol 2-dehydrogenase/D-chiro-inositol 1-dehydrogenase